MALDFVNTQTNPNLINPGASIGQGLNTGVMAGLQLRQQALQKQLTMAGLGEQSREFDLMQQLREQQFGVEKQMTAGQIGMLGAETQLYGQQLQNQQFALSQ